MRIPAVSVHLQPVCYKNHNIGIHGHLMRKRKIKKMGKNGPDRLISVGLIVAVIGLTIILSAPDANAQDREPGPNPDNNTCFMCHHNPNLTTTLPSGEVINQGVDEDAFNAGVHGEAGLSCRECHSNITGYPHPEIDFESHRTYTIARNTTCIECHSEVTAELSGNVHEIALAEGDLEAAVCTDCHGSHDTISLRHERSIISHTCQGCHSQIFNLYRNSVHGSALLGEGNPDVPGCVDCHGAHTIKGPSNGQFHLFSPEICARCHTDPELMDPYGINTNVMDTWVRDFHGTTVVLFQEVAPDQQTDKAVCVDCHGVHDILPPDDPNSHVLKENLLETCRKCHPNASVNFPDAWMSHYDASLDSAPIVFWVTWFYRLRIPAVIGGMLVFVVSDFIRQRIDIRKEKNNG